MIDTSDGLSTDLGHICDANSVGALVWRPKIPTAKIPLKWQRMGFNPLNLAIHGGEDYELLFTVPKKFSKRLPREVKGVPVTVIGEITRAKNMLLVGADGKSMPLQPKGWDPFRKS
jgi:thiamine-monophosphate kinase